MKLIRLSAACLAPAILAGAFAACGGGGDGTPSAAPKTLQERLFSGNTTDFAKQQQLIRECMVKQGFEYTPQDNRADGPGGNLEIDTTSEDFVKEYGFGISTLFGSQISFRSEDSDPNAKYRNGLSDAQQKAYDKALYGQELGGGGTFTAAGGGPVVAVPIGSGASTDGGDGIVNVAGPGGCTGEAIKTTSGAQKPFDPSVFDALAELEARIKADPKMVDAMKKWSACMKDAGYDYRDRDAAVKELQTEFGDLTGLKIGGDGNGFVISVSGVASSDDGSGKTFDPLANVDKAKLSQLQDKEKRIALASLTCSQDNVAKVEQKVREKYEADFLADHPDLGAK
ncbi:MAG: hypothetical protein ABI577_10520 [bacterium]